MILRFDVAEALSGEAPSAWLVVNHVQGQPPQGAWAVTQPSHAALSGEIAAKLAWPGVPVADSRVIEAIALHDAGWGPVDAPVIRALRAEGGQRSAPAKSFLHVAPAEIMRAWLGSITTAEKVSAIAGWLVSRHFWRIGEMARAGDAYSAEAKAMLEQFGRAEQARQQKLAPKTLRQPAELEELTDLLQFCDLLSLYLCCGATQAAQFSHGKLNSRIEFDGGSYRMDPSPFPEAQEFEFAGVRPEGARNFRVRIR